MKNLLKSTRKIAKSMACLALLTFVSSASATVLLTDNFNVDANANPDANQNLNYGLGSRQTGPLAPSTYDGWALQHQVGNTGTDVGQPGGVASYGGGYALTALNGSWFSDLDIATVSSGPLTIDFDMFQKNDGSTEWGAFAIRFPGSSFPVAGANEFGFLQRRNGGVQVFQNGNVAGTGTWDTAGFAPTNHWTLIFTDTAGTGSAFVGNGSKVTIMNGTVWTNTITLSQLNSKNLRMGWNASGNGFCGIDNLVIQGTPAQSIPNLSFEQDSIGGGNIAAFTGWHRFIATGTNTAVGGSGGDIGSEVPSSAEYSVNNPMGAPANGNQFLFVNMFDSAVTGGVYQVMGPMIPNHTYNLVVAIGSRADRVNSPGIISLVNGDDNTGTVLATTNGLPATQNSWEDYSLQYTTGPTVSGNLTICLSVVGDPTLIQADFDNVRLDPNTNAPQPAVMLQNTRPTRVETFVGDQVVFTAAYSNDPPVSIQWQQITTGPAATNNINTGVVNVTNNGVVTSTLTLNNVQLSDVGSYRVKGLNATNGTVTPAYSTAAPLAVGTPATAGNVMQENSGQAGPSSFYPAWTMGTNSDLIFGFSTGAGNAVAGPGNYSLESPLSGDPSVLTDGNLNSAKSNMVSCGWVNVGAGQSMTYTLPSGPTYGYEITNITVYGGWPDDGRNEQKYQVLYSTFSSPSTFVSIGTFDYNPSFNDGAPNSTRVILVPQTGVLAHNVAAVQINFNMQSKNNWNGYSEITIGATPSVGVIPTVTQDITPLTAEDVVGSTLTMTGAFSGATSYQWQKNGTNLIGQTTPTLTLSNLQPGDTATNGGYRLLGINSAGTNVTRGCSVVVDPNPAATNNIITAFAYQTSDAGSLNPFSPTWDTTQLGASLIAGQNPPSGGYGPGNFNDPDVNFPGSAGGLPVLTDGNYGTFAYDGSHPAFAAAGPAAGEYVTYTLGTDPNGYSITNIQIAGGWNDNGRDSQYYTILYSTVANTNLFLPLTTVSKNLSGYGVNDSTTIRTTITPATGVLASNVYAIEVDFQYPQGVPNGYSGYSEISVFGSPSATAPPAEPVITAAHEETSNIWTVETPNLIANQLPSSFGPGAFTQEGCNVTNLTDGQLGFGFAYGASCGAQGGAVPWVIFNSTTGWNLTNIVVYSLWNDYGRDGQFYNVSYSTLSNPTTFLPLASVAYNPFVAHNGTATGNRVQISPPVGQALLASNVYAVKFDFTPQGSEDYGWSGYSEIVLQGTNLSSTVLVPPTFAPPKISGGNMIVTGTGGSPGAGYTWLTATNVATPAANWTTNTTGALDGSGALSNAFSLDIAQPAKFFRLRMP